MKPLVDAKIYAIKGRFNYIYVLNGEHITIIDPELPSSVVRVLRDIRDKLKRRTRDIKAIYVTHAHPDHIGGLSYLVRRTQPQVALPHRSRPIIEGKEKYILSPRDALCLLTLMVRHKEVPTWRDILQADIVGFPPVPNRFHTNVSTWLKEGDTLPLDPEWKVLETPGHSKDSLSFYNGEKESLICGDLILNLDGRLFLNPIVMEDRTVALQSLEKLRQLKVTHLYPGYGSPLSKPSVLAHVVTDRKCLY